MSSKTLQQMLQEFMDQGGTVIVCPSCLKQAGISEEELIQGVIMGSSEVIETSLYSENVKVMSW